MVSLKTISLFTGSQGTMRKRPVLRPIMILRLSCYLKQMSRRSSMSRPHARRRKTHFRTALFLQMRRRKRTRKWFFSGLPRVLTLRSSVVLWVCINMDLPLRPVPMRSGLRLQSKIHGTSPLSLKNFPRLIKSLLRCQNAGIYIPHHLSCSVLPSLQRHRKCPTRPSRRVLPG